MWQRLRVAPGLLLQGVGGALEVSASWAWLPRLYPYGNTGVPQLFLSRLPCPQLPRGIRESEGASGGGRPSPHPTLPPSMLGESCICAGPNWGPRLLVPRGQRGPENTTGCPVHSLRLQRAATFPIRKCRFLVYDVEANCRRWGGESANVVFKLCFGVGSLARNKPSSPSPPRFVCVGATGGSGEAGPEVPASAGHTGPGPQGPAAGGSDSHLQAFLLLRSMLGLRIGRYLRTRGEPRALPGWRHFCPGARQTQEGMNTLRSDTADAARGRGSDETLGFMQLSTLGSPPSLPDPRRPPSPGPLSRALGSL